MHRPRSSEHLPGIAIASGRILRNNGTINAVRDTLPLVTQDWGATWSVLDAPDGNGVRQVVLLPAVNMAVVFNGVVSNRVRCL